MRRIDGQHVDLARDQFLRAFQKIARGAQRRPDAQASLLSLAAFGYFSFF